MISLRLCLVWWLALPLLAKEAMPPVGDVSELEGEAQGTTYSIRYAGPQKSDLKKLVDEQLAAFDKVFSNYRPDSEISRFNQQISLDWFPVDADLVTLVALSHGISEQSQGAFDITVGPLVKAWGFGPFKRSEAKIPSDAEIAKAKKLVDYRQLQFRKKPAALRKMNPGIYIDVSGIAQGYSVDKIANFLESVGIKNYMVEIGGEIRVKGQKLPGKDWRLAIDTPSAEPGDMQATLSLTNKAVTTAGDYRDFFEKDGKRYSHTIDPRSGGPIKHVMASMTVVADTAVEADGWDTALLVLGPEESRRIVRERHIAAYMILHKGSGFVTESLGGFEKYLLRQ